MPDTSEQKKSLGEQFTTDTAPIGLPWRLLIFSGVLFGMSIMIYFGFKLGYESYLNSRVTDLDNQLSQLSNSINQQDQQKFVGFYSQIANLKTVLNQHIFTANVFPFLEKNTLPQIAYSEGKFNSQTLSMELFGRASSLQVLAQQLSQFEKAPELKTAVLKSTDFNQSGFISFTMSLSFTSDFLSKPI
ncbi:MAG: hypothetical protein ABSE68_02750 [Minisyncoccia bacterium]